MSPKPTTPPNTARRSAAPSAQPNGSAGNGRAPANGRGSTARGAVTTDRQASYTVPGLSADEGATMAAVLQERLVSMIDLSLTLKHIHWNVVGPNFIAVHQMLDPQHAGVQEMVDDLAERIATLGGSPSGLPGRVVQQRSWDDYELDRADSIAHLGALDLVYQGTIADHRAAIETAEGIDPVSQDLLTGQAGILERYHWFVRSHLEDFAGGMSNAGASTELQAAQAVATKSSSSKPRAGAGAAGRTPSPRRAG